MRALRLRPVHLSGPLSFTISAGAVVLALVLQFALLPDPAIAPFLFFFPGVAVTAFVVGRLPGLVAALLSAVAGNHFFVPPYGGWALSQPALVATALFVIASVAVALLFASFRDAFLDLEQAAAERKRAEEILRRRETTLQQAGHMAHLGAWEIEVQDPEDLNANRLTWSDEVYRIFGYEPGGVEVTNDLFFERVHPDDRQRVADTIATAIRARRPYQIEHRIVRPDGEERVVHEHAELLFDVRGKLTRTIGAVQDVTERRRAERALRESEQRMKRTQEIAHLGSWELELATNRLSWSDEVYRIFGLEPQAFGATYETFLEAVHPDDRAAVDAAYSGSLRDGRDSYEIDHRVVRRSTGEIRIVHEKCDHLRDESGRIVRSVGMVHDVTERKRAEEELLDADRRKSEFLGVLSHELRNPLAPIRNALYILDRAAADGEQAERARAVVARQVDHLTRLVDDLLDVTRISRGKITLQRRRIDLREVVQRTIEDHRHVLAAREIALDVRVGSEPLFVVADPTRVAQIVGNLVQNSAKFTDTGGRVAVTAERDGERATVRVRDTGIGVAPDMLGRMFEPFTQADETLHRTRGGLGLGLALVRGLVELHGGTVEASSEGIGRGTEVVVGLPLAPMVHEAPPRPRPVPAPSRPRRILVVEDNLDAAATLREMLELWDHEVAVAHAGRQGIERARAFGPEIVLCDIGLPEMDGYEVARTIRADPAFASTVLVAVTGYALPEDQRRAADAGFEFHVAKPVTVAQMEDVLARAASTWSGRGASGS